MSDTVWQVKWYTNNGEECSEDFDDESDAQAFIKYNDWKGNEHPKLTEVELAADF